MNRLFNLKLFSCLTIVTLAPVLISVQPADARNTTIASASSPMIVNLHNTIAGRQDFLVKNETTTDIVRLYVSTSNSTDWEEDVLGNDVLEAGTASKINFANSTQGCYHDIKAVFRDGEILERRDLNLCELRSYTFTN